MVVSGEAMAAGPEVRRDHAEHRQEPLGSAGCAEAFSTDVEKQVRTPTPRRRATTKHEAAPTNSQIEPEFTDDDGVPLRAGYSRAAGRCHRSGTK
jgi:hypothetical protein